MNERIWNRIFEFKPSLNIFGHIHEGYGVTYENETTFVNASICNSKYEPINKPITIELKEVYGELIATYVEE